MADAALVTGGSKRVGQAICLALAKAGYDIAMHVRTADAAADAAVRQVAALGRRCELFPADLSDMAAVQALIGRVFDAMPACNMLVNSASIFEPGDLLQTDEALLDRHFDINFKAPLLLSRDFSRRCRAGQIVNILDTRVTGVAADHFAYGLSKKALEALTRMSAKALAPNIRVNAVCPGLILPPAGQDAAYLDRLAQRVPMKRKGEPADVAAAVVFLAQSQYITGQLIFVDGGENLI